MTLNPQIALFAALLAALGGPTQAASSEETEAGEFRKAQPGLHQFMNAGPRPETPQEIEAVPSFSK